MGCCNIRRRRRRQIKHNNNNNNDNSNNPSSLSALSTSSRNLLVLLLSNDDDRRLPGGGSCVLWSNNNNNNNSDENDDADDEKLICFVRHGCTYMNEYLSRTNSYFGSPNFTDIFPSPERELYYLDTPLSERGIKQAQNLAAKKLKNNNNNNKRSSSWTSTTTSMFPFINNKNNHRRQMSYYNDCELVVVSPLRRALQTLDYGIKPNLPNDIPIIALPEASERLYLISDVGRPLQTTMNEFPYVDFTHCINTTTTNRDDNNHDNEWWYTPPSHKSNNNNIEQEEEWRPIDNGQKYECSGEPEHIFMERMEQLCIWLSQRPETKITIICHHGVIYSMTNIDFYNCQWKVIPLSSCIPYNKKM